MPEILGNIQTQLERSRNILITAHLNPDGDTVGSQLALAEALDSLGRTVRIINHDAVPPVYCFLPGSERIEQDKKVNAPFDLAFVLECAKKERTGLQGLEPPVPVINIDHHPGNTLYGDINWVDPTAGAVGQMIYELIQFLQIPLTQEMATNLYTAIYTDTGAFNFSNTSADVLRTCGDLLDHEISPTEIADHLRENTSFQKMLLLGQVLSTLEQDESGSIVWLTMTRRAFEESGAAHADTEGLIDYTRRIVGVRVALFFKEIGEREIRISFRSSDNHDVSSFAAQFGGGGHKHAAACTLYEDLASARKRLISAARQAFRL